MTSKIISIMKPFSNPLGRSDHYLYASVLVSIIELIMDYYTYLFTCLLPPLDWATWESGTNNICLLNNEWMNYLHMTGYKGRRLLSSSFTFVFVCNFLSVLLLTLFHGWRCSLSSTPVSIQEFDSHTSLSYNLSLYWYLLLTLEWTWPSHH